MARFSHLHVHTEYSLLNSTVRIKDLVKRAKTLNMQAVAITDYGNIFGAVEFFEACEKENIKPILGCEVFLPSYDDHKLKQYRRGQDVYWQLVLLVKNQRGYENLSQLISRSHLDGFYYKPRVDTGLLKLFSEDLIALSSGFNSEIDYHLFQGDEQKAKQAIEKYAKIFPENFYLELQDNGLPMQRQRNEILVSLAKKVGVPCVATNNVYYLDREDVEAFDILRGIQIGGTIRSPQDQVKFSTDAYHFRSEEEMRLVFEFCPEAVDVTENIVRDCDFRFEYGTYHLPHYNTPVGKTLDEFMEEQALQGFEETWGRIKKLSKVTDDDKPRYLDRLRQEIRMIQKVGFSGYFLIVSDFIKWAKSKGIPVGPGRGSGAGSLVAFCLKITNLDPLAYNLLFERFINPERISLPDFDIDFCQDRRSEVIDYVTKKYGNVSQIITFGKMKARAVIRDVGRVMELEYDFVDKIAKLIPNELGITLEKALEKEADLKALYEKDSAVHRLIDTSLRLEGLSRHASVHAAGVIITDKPLWKFVPLYKGSHEDVVVQFDMKSAEKIGLVKFDFLGLKTLTVLEKAVENIEIACGKKIDIETLPMDDKTVYEMLCSGEGCGVFQLESSGMCDLMKRLQPNCFGDIIALVALYRPGPLGSGMVDDFIMRKKGLKDVSYPLPELEEILKETYGVIVYQEQVMQIAAKLANYSMGEADLLRRAMGKKKMREMSAQQKRFLEGASQNQINPEMAQKIFDLMAKFGEYGFNKSHSAAYALISYQTAFLKTHYPAEYMAALMTSEMEDTDKVLFFMNDAKKHGIEFLPPDVNESQTVFTVCDGKIRYALAAIKGIGQAAIDAILEARKNGPFQSFFDFCLRVDLRRVTKKVVEMLIKSGAMDVWGLNRQTLFESIGSVMETAAHKQKSERLGQFDLFGKMDRQSQTPVGVSLQENGEWLESEKLKCEKEALGFYFSNHPLSPFEKALHKLTMINIADLSSKGQDEFVIIGGVVISSRAITTKKGDRMAFIEFEDLTGSLEIVVFPRTYKKHRDLLESDEPLIIKGRVDRSGESAKIIVEELTKLTETLKQSTRSIHLDIPLQEFTKSKIDRVIDIIQKYNGQSRVYFHLKKEGEFETVVQLPEAISALACEPLLYHIDQIFDGHKIVHFH